MAVFTIDSSFLGSQAIPDLATITNQIALKANVPTGVVPTLQVFLNVRHTFNTDLDVTLTNPDGTAVGLWTDIGSASDGFNVVLSDAALTDIGLATASSDDAGIRGTFNPEGAALLSSLASGNLTGNWTLSLTDDLGGDVGALISWGIHLTYDYSGSVIGTGAAETLRGSNDADVVYGLAGNDVLRGFDGNDLLVGNEGDDQLFGGSGNDRLDGGSGNDSLFGDDDNDRLIGGIGNDRLEGGLGDDVLNGGRGKDALLGGLGADRFDFDSVKDSVRGSQRDTVYFSRSEGDELDLRTVDASTRRGGDQAFDFIGSSRFSNEAGELRYANKLLQGDTNGDGRADFEIKIVGSLSSADLLL